MTPVQSIALQTVLNGPSYFQFIGLSQNLKLMHGIFTRQGGVSKPPYGSLNISDSVEDRQEAVKKNILRIKKTLKAERVFSLNQCHGKDVFVLTKANAYEINIVPAADAVITDMPMVALMIKQADCQGVILYHPEKHVAAAVHCGWRGNVQNILASVVLDMKKKFGCDEGGIKAGIGPSLGPCCGEFADYKNIFPSAFERFMVSEKHFDLWGLSRFQLETAGLLPRNIEIAGICTRCRTDLFFSYRAEGRTGRFGTVAMLK